jgi:hypothetical protein
MSDNIDIIVQDTINDIIVNSSTIVETIDIVVEASVEEVTIISNPNDYIININRVIGEQVQSDWNETQPNDPSYIKNKPTIPAAQVNSDWNATSGVAEILNKPTIPAEQVNSDWNATSGKAQILNKPTIPSISGLATITYVDTQDALKVDKIAGKGLSTNDFTNTLKTKLDGIQDGAEVNVNADWNATSGDARILNKPTIPSISGLATITYVDAQDALKVDKVTGKGLSTNDFTNTLKTKLDGIQDGAEVNVNADWNATSGDAQILNKPTIPAAVTNTSDLINDGADGVNPFITALDIPTTSQASTLVREVKNMTGATLTKGTVVYISGANGNKILVSKAQASSESLSSRTFGLLQSDILNNGVGNCVIVGDLNGLDTSSFTEGAQLYLSPTTAGAYTTTKPSAPDHLVYIGKITRSHPTQGQIEVQIQNGYELQELHNVAINGVTNNQLLSYDSSTSLWKNKSVTTADIADSTNKRYVTDANLTTIGNQSGTNTGDETDATIKSKLGITTLSGSNTGDQDLSGLVPNTRTINTKALSSDVTLTTADIADSTDKRYVTDANLTTIGNQSGTNTGDNAVNSLYSGLATSKQDTLVSGTNIKTINGNSLLGSGDLTISGGSGLQGIHAIFPLPSGSSITSAVNSLPLTSANLISNRLYAMPFNSAQSFTTSSLYINCSTLQASALARILIYSDLNGLPDQKLYESSNLDLSTTGIKTASTTFTITAGTTYWLCVHSFGTAALSHIQTGASYPLRTSGSQVNVFVYGAPTFGSAPTTFPFVGYNNSVAPMVGLTKV